MDKNFIKCINYIELRFKSQSKLLSYLTNNYWYYTSQTHKMCLSDIIRHWYRFYHDKNYEQWWLIHRYYPIVRVCIFCEQYLDYSIFWNYPCQIDELAWKEYREHWCEDNAYHVTWIGFNHHIWYELNACHVIWVAIQLLYN